VAETLLLPNSSRGPAVPDQHLPLTGH
jgi:hypothetical protein